MAAGFYTHARWKVREGATEAFLRVWRDELAAAFRRLSPRAQGTLIQSIEEPTLFYSFGPWDTLDEMEAARADPEVRAALMRLRELCTEATPGAFRVALTVPA